MQKQLKKKCGQTRPVFRVQMGRVGPQDPKTGPIRSGWSQKGFKFGFNTIMYLLNPIWTQPYPFLGRVGPSGSKIRLSWVGLALRVKIWVKFGSGWTGWFCRTIKSPVRSCYLFSKLGKWPIEWIAYVLFAQLYGSLTISISIKSFRKLIFKQ